MKRIVIYSLSVFLIAGAAMSCKKTSKGKMSNEWQMSEYSSTETETDNNGETYTSTITSDGSSITVTSTNSNGGSSSAQGVLNDYSYTINKDGTWEEMMDATITYTDGNGTTVEHTVTTTTGTWNFLGKIEEFKKNERVVFNTLTEDETFSSTTTSGGISFSSSNSSSYTYANGEESEIMLVVESKRKELQLKTERDYTSQTVQNNGNVTTSSVTAETEWSLVQE